MARKGPHRAVDLRPEYERLGNWLKEQRNRVGRSQRDVSECLRKPVTYLSKVENGKQRLDVVELIDLVRELGLEQQVRLADLVAAVEI